MEYVFIAWARKYSLKITSMISQAYFIWFSCNTRSNYPSWVWFIPMLQCRIPAFSQWKRSQPETLSVWGLIHTFLSLRAVQTLWQESSSICKCLCDYWCCCLRDVKLLLGFIPEIWKSVAILGPHKDPKEPCLSVSLMLVAVVYFQYLFQKNSQENIKKADVDLIFLIQSSILRWFQTGLRHSFSQMLILCSHCDGMDHYTL